MTVNICWRRVLQNSKKLIPGKSVVATILLMLATYGIFEAYQAGYSKALNEQLDKRLQLEQEIDVSLQHLTKNYDEQIKELTNHNSELEIKYIASIESLEKSEVEIERLESQLKILEQAEELEFNSPTVKLKSTDIYDYTIQLIKFYESQIEQLNKKLTEFEEIALDEEKELNELKKNE